MALVPSIILIMSSPSVMKNGAIFPLENPGILGVPLGFLAAIVGTFLSREP